MASFTDTAGRTWAVAINVDALRRCRNLLDVNLLDVVDGELLERLITDPILLCDVLFVVVKPEADARGVSDEDFGRALGGDAIDHATTALLEGLAAFFPSAKAAVIRKAIAKLRTLEQLAIETTDKRLDALEINQALLERIASTPGSSSTK